MNSHVREIREALGMSPEETCAEAGISLRTLQSIEGGAMPRVKTALKLADAFTRRKGKLVTIADLFSVAAKASA